MKLAVVGYGALGKQLEQYARDQQEIDSITVFDDIAVTNGVPDALPFSGYKSDHFQDHTFAIGIGYHHFQVRQEVCETLLQQNRTLFTYVSPHAAVHHSARVAPGCTLLPGVVIELHAVLGHGVIAHEGTTVAHDSRLGAYSYLGPGVCVSGDVAIGNRCFLGTGVLVANGVSIGDDVVVGIGTVVTHDIPDSVSVIGNPARILRKHLKLQ